MDVGMLICMSVYIHLSGLTLQRNDRVRTPKKITIIELITKINCFKINVTYLENN